MRLEITRRSDLASRALLALEGRDGPTKASVLAEEIGTTPGFLSQAMTPLAAKGWVRSEPGPTGGYRLLVAPEEISVLDVIEAIEGPTDTGRCVVADRPCGAGRCAMHDPWSAARRHLLDELGSTSLAAAQVGAP